MIFMGYYRYLNAYPSNNPNLNPTYIMYIYINIDTHTCICLYIYTYILDNLIYTGHEQLDS